MKKKLKDLTDEELDSLCKKHHDCTKESGKVNCPLWYGSRCMKGYISLYKYLQKEVDL